MPSANCIKKKKIKKKCPGIAKFFKKNSGTFAVPVGIVNCAVNLCFGFGYLKCWGTVAERMFPAASRFLQINDPMSLKGRTMCCLYFLQSFEFL